MLDGVVVVDKEPGWTSHDVVAKLRGVLHTKKVGHAGTLDPGATGVLVVGVGKMTRLLRFLGDSTKAYSARIQLGSTTTTLDAEGEVTATFAMDATLADVRAAAAQLTGRIKQIPPMVSAVQVGGKRLHELARKGIEVEREARPVVVDRFDVDWLDEGAHLLEAEIECSAGTYVRVLADDLGRLVGGGAHLSWLRRTRAGRFTLADARPLVQVDESCIIPMADALELERVAVDDEVAAAVRVGKVLGRDVLAVSGAGPWSVLDATGALLAVYESHKGTTVKPAVVVA